MGRLGGVAMRCLEIGGEGAAEGLAEELKEDPSGVIFWMVT